MSRANSVPRWSSILLAGAFRGFEVPLVDLGQNNYGYRYLTGIGDASGPGKRFPYPSAA